MYDFFIQFKALGKNYARNCVDIFAKHLHNNILNSLSIKKHHEVFGHMSEHAVLLPIQDIQLDAKELLQLKREQLLPLLNDQYKLNHYADHVVQAQSVLLNGVDPHLTQQLSQSIEKLISVLNASKKVLKKRKFNAFQKWLGIDLDHGSNQLEYYKNLDQLLDQTNQLSRKLQVEIQKSQARFQQLVGLREQMARHITAAEQFLNEYPQFVKEQSTFDHFAERLAKKIYSLRTLQASNDIAMGQMQLSQQLSFSLLDRYKEAQHVLLPAWQYHVKQSQLQHDNIDLTKLDQSREHLIKTLQQSLKKSSDS